MIVICNSDKLGAFTKGKSYLVMETINRMLLIQHTDWNRSSYMEDKFFNVEEDTRIADVDYKRVRNL